MAAFTPIVATLGYVMSHDDKSVLMIHRNTRPDDLHLGKYNGLGGKLDPHEDVATGMRREIMEEAGIAADELVLRGTISWPGFGKNGEDWLGFIFRVDGWTGTPLSANAEGTLEWVRLDGLLAGDVPLWEGDAHFLPLVFGKDAKQFHGIMPYKDGKMVNWSYTQL